MGKFLTVLILLDNQEQQLAQHLTLLLEDVSYDVQSLIEKIIPLVEKVAQEKGHPGVITRDLFVALGRAAS